MLPLAYGSAEQHCAILLFRLVWFIISTRVTQASPPHPTSSPSSCVLPSRRVSFVPPLPFSTWSSSSRSKTTTTTWHRVLPSANFILTVYSWYAALFGSVQFQNLTGEYFHSLQVLNARVKFVGGRNSEKSSASTFDNLSIAKARMSHMRPTTTQRDVHTEINLEMSRVTHVDGLDDKVSTDLSGSTVSCLYLVAAACHHMRRLTDHRLCRRSRHT